MASKMPLMLWPLIGGSNSKEKRVLPWAFII
jgi:hypothetical protein